MKIVSQCALAGALVMVAHACATPIDISGCTQVGAANCDVILASPSEFDVDGGTQPGRGGSGSTNGGSGGATGAATGGAGGLTPGVGGAASGTGGRSGSGTGGTAGTGGTGAGGSSTAGAGGLAGTGGRGGAAGTGGTGGTAGTGGTGSSGVFSSASCDFEDLAGCQALACATACPTGMGTYCTNNCALIVTCATNNVDCLTAEDPMCALRSGNVTKACTMIVENSGGRTSIRPSDPSFVARNLVECLCSEPRP